MRAPLERSDRSRPRSSLSSLRTFAANAVVGLHVRDSPALLLGEQLAHDGCRLGRTLVADAQASDPPWIGTRPTSKSASPWRRDERVERGDREVAEVLVVDRVELATVEHVLHVRHLDHGDPVLRQQRRETGDEVVEARRRGRARCAHGRHPRASPRRRAAPRGRSRRTRRSWGFRALRATAATFRAGSMPRTRTPRSR